jgi:hypothetical protein
MVDFGLNLKTMARSKRTLTKNFALNKFLTKSKDVERVFDVPEEASLEGSTNLSRIWIWSLARPALRAVPQSTRRFFRAHNFTRITPN